MIRSRTVSIMYFLLGSTLAQVHSKGWWSLHFPQQRKVEYWLRSFLRSAYEHAGLEDHWYPTCKHGLRFQKALFSFGWRSSCIFWLSNFLYSSRCLVFKWLPRLLVLYVLVVAPWRETFRLQSLHRAYLVFVQRKKGPDTWLSSSATHGYSTQVH